MDPKKILQAYMAQFYKTAGAWARESDTYENRNAKRKFNDVMREMDRFARRYMGMNNYGAYYEDLLLYMLRNGIIVKNAANDYDVSLEKYIEYQTMR